MKTIVWFGPKSSNTQKIYDFLCSDNFKRNHSFNFFDEKTFNSMEPKPNVYLALSEYSQLQSQSQSQTLPTENSRDSFQIFCCRSFELNNFLQSGVRPLNRFFYLYDQQNLTDFEKLLNSFSLKYTYHQNKPHYQTTLPSMKNSLAVLNKLANERLDDLHRFSVEDEARKKHFRSIIRLIRNLSMSRDLEDIAYSLWSELKTINNIHSIFFLMINKLGTVNQIYYRSGKFYFESLRQTTANQKDFLRAIIQNKNTQDLFKLSSEQIESLSFLLKRTLKKTITTSFYDINIENHLALFMEVGDDWVSTSPFKDQLYERLSFIRLTFEKHFLQESIKSKANLWAATFDNLFDPLAIIDSENQIVRSNQRFCQVFKEDKKTSTPSSLPSDFHHLPEVIKTKIGKIEFSEPFEISSQNKIYRTRIYPIEVGQRHPQAHIIHAVDISAERALYSRMTQSEKMVAVGQLAGNLSEALSKPLKEISMHSQPHKLSELPPTLQNDLNEIHKASVRSLKIIEDFEKFSQGTLVKSSLFAESAIEKTIPLIKAIIHGHRFHLHLSETRHLIHGSISLIQQVLYNLLRNAHQSMPTPGQIEITTESCDKNSIPGVLITVQDTGLGVPEEMRPLLFQPFVSNKGPEGTGLGLNIVKQIIESHDGTVGYDPRQGGGSVFWIWLPLYK